jgi:hypothetical protein
MCLRDLQRVIGRAAVYDDMLNFGVILAQDAAYTFLKKLSAIESRCDYADFHS